MIEDLTGSFPGNLNHNASHKFSGSLLNPNVYDLLVSPSNKNLVLAATGNDIRTPSQDGIYRSVDGAKTWRLVHQFKKEINGTPRVGKIGRLAVAPDDPSLMYAAGQFGVGISRDAGETWTESVPPNFGKFKYISCSSRSKKWF